jgi:hypothetical protein
MEYSWMHAYAFMLGMSISPEESRGLEIIGRRGSPLKVLPPFPRALVDILASDQLIMMQLIRVRSAAHFKSSKL